MLCCMIYMSCIHTIICIQRVCILFDYSQRHLNAEPTNMSCYFIDLSLIPQSKMQRFFSTSLWRYWVWSRVFPAAFPTCSTSCARFGAKNLVESKEFQKGYCALHRVRGKTSLCFCRKTQGVGSFVFFLGMWEIMLLMVQKSCSPAIYETLDINWFAGFLSSTVSVEYVD